MEWQLTRDDPGKGRAYFATHRGITYVVTLDPADEGESCPWLLGVDVADQTVETLLLEESEYQPLENVLYPNPEAALEDAVRWMEGVSHAYYELRRQSLGWPES